MAARQQHGQRRVVLLGTALLSGRLLIDAARLRRGALVVAQRLEWPREVVGWGRLDWRRAGGVV
eukprot:15439791-Alexandrium_andersonii.AAC.1